MDSRRLKELKELILREGNAMKVYNIASFRDGKIEKIALLSESKTDIYSLSKNLTSLCIGILLDEGKLSLDEDTSDIFLSSYPKAISYKGCSIKDLLQQRSGIKNGFLDVDCDSPSSFYTDDYLSIIFEKGLYYQKDKPFVYSDSNYYLLGRIVEQKSQQKLDEFIIERLFSPLSITDFSFDHDPLGHPLGATGVYLDSASVTKIGSLFLSDGLYENKRIVSSSYIASAKNDLIDTGGDALYGYSIWVNKKSGIRHGNGMRGQLFALFESEVIAVVSDDRAGKIAPINELLLR